MSEMLSCRGCGIELSAEARVCPQCGFVFTRPADASRRPWLLWVGAGAVGLLLAFVLWYATAP